MSKKRELRGDGYGPRQDEVGRLQAEMDAEDEADEDTEGDREDRFAWDEDGISGTMARETGAHRKRLGR